MNINFTMFSQAVAFGIFIWFTVRFVWPFMIRAIEARQKEIADGLAAAERGKHELELAGKRAAEVLRDAKHQAQDIMAQAEKRAAVMVDEAKASAKTEGERLVVAAKAEIDQEVNRARENLRVQVAALAVAGAEKILRREVDAKAHADILSSIQAQL